MPTDTLVGPATERKRFASDPRCMTITLDPDAGEKEPALLNKLAQAHNGMTGVYGAVLVEGTLHKGGPVEVVK